MTKKQSDIISSFSSDFILNSLPLNIYWKDNEGRFLGCNQSQAKIFNIFPPASIIGKTNSDFFESADASFMDDIDRQVISNQCSVLVKEPNIKPVPQESFVITKKSPLIDINKQVIGVISTSIDISKHDQKYILSLFGEDESETALSTIISLLPGNVFWKDKKGRFLGCNVMQAKAIGYDSPEMLIGKTAFDTLPSEQAEKITQTDLRIMASGESVTVEEISDYVGNEMGVYLSQKAPLINKLGEVVGIIGISFDITDRKKLEEELRIAKEAAEAASLAKSAFIANISHDTRLPLTGVIGLSSALEEPFIPDAERIELAQMINDSGNALLEFSESVLDDVTASSMTQDEVIHAPFDIHKIIHDILALGRPTTKMKNLSLEICIDPAIPRYLVGDKKKLHCILLNLTGNAIKFTKVGWIELRAQLIEKNNDDVKIEFSVKDTGIGIPEEHQSKVFEQFYKITPSYKGLYKGYGIGLHLVKTYVNLLGGTIKLSSEVDVGTTFSFILTMKIGEKPAIADEPLELSKSQTPAVLKTVEHKQNDGAVIPQEIIPNKMQVLLVEDNTSAMMALRVLIKPFGVQVIEAVDAEKAYDLVKSQAFDLIITDVGLPGKQGDELTKMIRAFEKETGRKHGVIIGCTGHTAIELHQAYMDAGMNEVCIKPMTKARLSALMDTYGHSADIDPVTPIKVLENKQLSNENNGIVSDKKNTCMGGGGALGADFPDTEE
jgi:two-component system aerobic respiration control sensor histidine kinase ArcB